MTDDWELTVMLSRMAQSMASTVTAIERDKRDRRDAVRSEKQDVGDRLLTHSGECFLDNDGRLRDADGLMMFTTRTFASVEDADYWLSFCDDDAIFCRAFCARRVDADVR